MTKTEIQKIKDIIDNDSKKKIQLETKLESLYERAEKDYNCKTVKALEKELDTLEEKLDEYDKEIEKLGEEIETGYEWDI